jgi:alkanesulfonate monooxygenase SsuD/methylene tetrahydromethanopterin reductase-like flavin-dependent oxidoreductase (luciferase family)
MAGRSRRRRRLAQQEFEAYGWEFGTAGQRMEKLEDTVRILDAMLTEPLASYQGKHDSIDRALNHPAPVRLFAEQVIPALRAETRRADGK